MQESEFNMLADGWLERAVDRLEEADENATLDAELQQGVLTIELPARKTLIVSKHGPTKQLWLSSPISGGLHFPYRNDAWVLDDGRTLNDILAQELQTLAQVKVTF